MRKLKKEHTDAIFGITAIIICHFALQFLIEYFFPSQPGESLALIMDLIGGLMNSSKAKKINTTRPQYEIPKEIFQNQAMYEAMANSSRVPGQSYIENQIGQNTAQAVGASQRAAGSSADALSAVSNINQNAQNMYTNLGMQGAELQNQAKDKLAGSRETVADYRQQEFDYNKNQPYLQRMKQKQKYEDQKRQNYSNMSNDIHEFGMSMSSMGMSGGGDEAK